MSNVKQVIEEYKVQVENSFPSIFTKGDVISLLSKMELSLSDVDFESGNLEFYKENLIDEIRNIVDEDVIVEGVELELSYGREINVTYDVSSLVESLEEMVERVVRVPEVL
jgi:hypothetical protein